MRKKTALIGLLVLLLGVSLAVGQTGTSELPASGEAGKLLPELMRLTIDAREGKRYKEALHYADRVLKIAEEQKDPAFISEVYLQLSLTYEALGDNGKALHFLKIHKEAGDVFAEESGANRVKGFQKQFHLEQKDKELALLERDNRIRNLELDKQSTYKRTMFVVLLLILLLLIIIYARYMVKEKAMRILSREIDERKRAEVELLKSRKLESIGILAGGVAHDFNDLLSVIMGNISMAREGAQDIKYASKLLAGAEKASHQAAELSQKLITFSRGGWLLCREFFLQSLLKSTSYYYPNLEPYLGNIDIPKNLYAIYGDERQLRQVMHNLLQNAGEAICDQKNGYVSICGENVRLGADNRFNLKEGDYVRVSVIDNGLGIPEENLPKVFDPYFSTKNRYSDKGLGLGLAICFSIVKKHKGHVRLVSKPGLGTRAEVLLPAVNQAGSTDNSRSSTKEVMVPEL